MKAPFAVAGVVCLLLVGWQVEAGEADYADARAAAEAAREKAANAGYEWLSVGPLLQQAAEAADAGDWDAAIRLADEARLLAELGLKQAEVEAERWQERVIGK